MANYLQLFSEYLKNKRITDKSVKNYLSDVRQFDHWFAKNNLNELSPGVFQNYRSYLLKARLPTNTINRYLASLRCFGSFIKEKNISLNNPASGLKNISKDYKNNSNSVNAENNYLIQFRQSLIRERLKPATIKNYISDVKQFMEFLKQHNN
jgi:site-specific recombinase XerD